MPQFDQGVKRDIYTVIPRTAIFLRQGRSYLLLKGAPTKQLWANLYNCLGGHVERGEDALSAARRELREEAGLEADMWLAGIVIVDSGETGICLYVVLGDNARGDIDASEEGTVEWVQYDRIVKLPVVEDLPILINRLHGMQRGDTPFSAHSFYDGQEKLSVVFSE